MACIDFTDLVVNDNVALEGLEAFTILVGNSMSMVTVIDDDRESSIAGFNKKINMKLIFSTQVYSIIHKYFHGFVLIQIVIYSILIDEFVYSSCDQHA